MQKENLSKQHISWLWIRLTELYTNLFISKYGNEDSGAWFETLKDLTPKAVKVGVERLISLEAGDRFAEFPPNPMQFRTICLGFYSGINLPDKHLAFQELQSLAYMSNDKNCHPVVRYIASKLPESFYSIADRNEAWTIFFPIYEKVCSFLYQGHELPEISELKTIKKAPSAEIARRHLDNLKAMLAGK